MSEQKKRVNYYPFGLQHKGYNTQITGQEHNYKYNGTELTEELGLNWYEMPLRSYDPAIARWNRIDPVVHHSLSTYNAFDNNPVFYADPSGGDSVTTGGFHMSGIHNGGDSSAIFWGGADSFQNSGLDTDDIIGGVDMMIGAMGALGHNFTWSYDNNSSSKKEKWVAIAGDGILHQKEGPIDDWLEKVSNMIAYGEFLTDKEFNSKYNESIEILVWEKVSDKDVGHTAIRINGVVYGYYPTDMDNNGVYDFNDLKNSTGSMHVDNAQDFKNSYRYQVVNSYDIKTTLNQKNQLLKELIKFKNNPGKYKLWGNQCTSVALKCMSNSNIKLRYGENQSISNPLIMTHAMSPNSLKNILENSNNSFIIRKVTTFTVK